LLGAETVKQDDPPVAEVIPLTLREPCPDCGGLERFAFYLRHRITLTGEAVVRETTAFAGQGDSSQTQSALMRIVEIFRRRQRPSTRAPPRRQAA
jgi:hypothetical protein